MECPASIIGCNHLCLQQICMTCLTCSAHSACLTCSFESTAKLIGGHGARFIQVKSKKDILLCKEQMESSVFPHERESRNGIQGQGIYLCGISTQESWQDFRLDLVWSAATEKNIWAPILCHIDRLLWNLSTAKPKHSEMMKCSS